MFEDPREAAEQYLLAQAQALTTSDGLPDVFRLVTRDYTHLADIERSGLFPTCLIHMEELESSMMVPKLSHVYEVFLPGRIIVCFASSFVLPATSANSYRKTLEDMLTRDIRFGGLIDQAMLRGTLMPALWSEMNLLALGVLFTLNFEYDPRLPALVA